jgi:hypothetical protein
MNAIGLSLRARVSIIVTVAVITACSWLPQIERLANEQIDAGLKRALITFAAARALNAAISIVQGTEFALQPAGIGINLAPGQVLDPVNDLVEQFSTLMLGASIAFGMQKVLLTIGSHWLISLTVTVFAVAWAGLFFLRRCPDWVSRTLAVLLLVRFAIPVATIGTDLAFRHFMAADYQSSQRSIDVTSGQVEKLAPPSPAVPENQSMIDRFKALLEAKAAEWKADYGHMKAAIEQATEHIVKLMAIFILQTLVIPTFLLWVLYRVATGAFRPSPMSRG